jgi:hypothetical protein
MSITRSTSSSVFSSNGFGMAVPGIVHKDIQTAECHDPARYCQTVLNRLVLYDDKGAARMQDY